jgi:hypothetical protein
MMPTMRDPNAMRIDTTPIGTEDLSKTSAVINGVDIDVDVKIRVGAYETADTAIGPAVVYIWSNCNVIG